MGFKLGKKSLRELEGVHPDMIQVVKKALKFSEIDFTIVDGIRTIEEQRDLVKRGVSQTMNSKHLRQSKTGYGHAVDLVGLINGKARWEWPVVYQVAEAMKQAAEDHGVKIRWGGSWCILNGPYDPETLSRLYIKSREEKGKKPFLDGPHFELA